MNIQPQEIGNNRGAMCLNILHFARALRAAGMNTGPSAALIAIESIINVELRRKEDFYWTLHCIFVQRHEEHEVFDQAFSIFWRDPKIIEQLMSDFRGSKDPNLSESEEKESSDISQRVIDALDLEINKQASEEENSEIEENISFSFSNLEVIQSIDFESMSSNELKVAKQAIAKLKLPIDEVKVRRFHTKQKGPYIDMRASLRASLRPGGECLPLKYRVSRKKPPPLVILCDISGSMSRYSRMFLHFVHAVTNDRDRVSTFIFGTALTNITRFLNDKDVDKALDQTSSAVSDWSGGTRIGECLRQFNISWARRVLGQGAVVLLVTDGLDRDDLTVLAHEVSRLHRSCRKLIWLNPLLRYEQFKPEAGGIRTILPYVDEFRSVHNIESLLDISKALSSSNYINNGSTLNTHNRISSEK